MHKGVILLMEAKSRAEAVRKTGEFMDFYRGQVWDWYVIGGRWAKTLNPLYGTFYEKAKEMCLERQKVTRPEFKNTDSVFQSTVESCAAALQQLWDDLGGGGLHPWSDHYKLPKDGTEDDVLPLEMAIEKVREWHQDSVECGKEQVRRAEEWLNGERGTNNYLMYGYGLKCAGEIFSEDFSLECNVFNTESFNFKIPENFDGWYAVMVDMHN